MSYCCFLLNSLVTIKLLVLYTMIYYKTAQQSVPEVSRDNAPDPRQPRHRTAGAGVGSRRVFEQFTWLEVGSVKMALSRPTNS